MVWKMLARWTWKSVPYTLIKQETSASHLSRPEYHLVLNRHKSGIVILTTIADKGDSRVGVSSTITVGD